MVVMIVTKETKDREYGDGDTVKVKLLRIYPRWCRQVEQLRLVCAAFVHFHFLKRGPENTGSECSCFEFVLT